MGEKLGSHIKSITVNRTLSTLLAAFANPPWPLWRTTGTALPPPLTENGPPRPYRIATEVYRFRFVLCRGFIGEWQGRGGLFVAGHRL